VAMSRRNRRAVGASLRRRRLLVPETTAFYAACSKMHTARFVGLV
jgi:hypothetical protein